MPGRESGALDAESGPVGWLAREVGRRGSEQCRKKKVKRGVGGEERKEGRKKNGKRRNKREKIKIKNKKKR